MLRPIGENVAVSIPCDRMYKSTCQFVCVNGYYGVGVGKAKCVLTANSSQVVWQRATFSCKGNTIFLERVKFKLETSLLRFRCSNH